jgi:hypothetical protein
MIGLSLPSRREQCETTMYVHPVVYAYPSTVHIEGQPSIHTIGACTTSNDALLHDLRVRPEWRSGDSTALRATCLAWSFLPLPVAFSLSRSILAFDAKPTFPPSSTGIIRNQHESSISTTHFACHCLLLSTFCKFPMLALHRPVGFIFRRTSFCGRRCEKADTRLSVVAEEGRMHHSRTLRLRWPSAHMHCIYLHSSSHSHSRPFCCAHVFRVLGW